MSATSSTPVDLRTRVARVVSLGIAAAVLVASASVAASERAVSGKALGNGLQVVVAPNHALPLVTIEIALRAGAFTEPPESDGLSHVYEHMFFKANAKVPSQERFLAGLRDLGAVWNATTGEERVNYFITVHRDHLRRGTELMRDALCCPRFEAAELAGEVAVILEEIARVRARPSFPLALAVNRRLWPRYFSRKNTIGDREVIENVTPGQMREIQSRYYVPNNAALIFAGDVRPDDVYALAETLFGDWARSADPHERWPAPAHPPLERTVRVAVPGSSESAVLMLTWNGPSLNEDVGGTYAADVLTTLLSQPSARFRQALENTGHFDAIDVYYLTLARTGPIRLIARTSPRRFDRAFRALASELAKLDSDGYFTDDEIQAAKRQLVLHEARARESTVETAHTISFFWASAGIGYYEDYLTNLQAVTRADLMGFYRRYLEAKPRVEGAMAPRRALRRMDFAETATWLEPETVVEGRGPRPVRPSEPVAVTKGGVSGVDLRRLTSVAGDGVDRERIATEEFYVDGLKVVLRRLPDRQLVDARMAFLGGLAYIGRRRAGQEAVLLEALDRGSRRFSRADVEWQLTRTGARITASAGHDFSSVTLSSHRRDLAQNFAVLADAITSPLLDDREVRGVVARRLLAIRNRVEHPESHAVALADNHFYRGHVYATHPGGSEKSVGRLDGRDVRKRHRDWIFRERMALYVAGDVTREELSRLIEAELGDVPHGDYGPMGVQQRMQAASRLRTVGQSLPTNYIVGYFAAPNRRARDFPAMQVALSVLSERLFEEIRTRRNLSYAVSARLGTRLANYGAIQVTTDQPGEALPLVLKEVARLIAEPVPPEVVSGHVERTITRDLMRKETSSSQTLQLAFHDIVGNGWESDHEVVADLRDVSPADVQRVAREYLNGFDFTVLGDPGSIDKSALGAR